MDGLNAPKKNARAVRYERLKRAGKCVRCEQQQAEKGRVHCEDCRIGLIWASNKSTAGDGGYEPFALERLNFIEWYKEKKKRHTVCEWCGEVFKEDPAVAYNRDTGKLRALVCASCSAVENFGLARLQKVVAGLMKREKATISDPNTSIESNFMRWAIYIGDSGKTDPFRLIVREIRSMCSSEEEVTKYYEKFTLFLETGRIRAAEKRR